MLDIMPTMSHRRWIVTGSLAVICLAIASTLFWSSNDQAQTANVIRIDRQKIEDSENEVAAPSSNVVPDFLRLKYRPAQRAKFWVTSSQPIAIAVWATGVQVRTESGWEPFSEEPRNETWRLKLGIAREMYVERPERETEQIWRAVVRYGMEIKGLSLLKVQLREAWSIRSFANWTGKAWGGGRFAGARELFSEEFTE